MKIPLLLYNRFRDLSMWHRLGWTGAGAFESMRKVFVSHNVEYEESLDFAEAFDRVHASLEGVAATEEVAYNYLRQTRAAEYFAVADVSAHMTGVPYHELAKVHRQGLALYTHALGCPVCSMTLGLAMSRRLFYAFVGHEVASQCVGAYARLGFSDIFVPRSEVYGEDVEV